MFDLQDWSLTELLDILSKESRQPVRIMEHILQCRSDALPALISRLTEVMQSRSDGDHPIWLMVMIGQFARAEAVPALIDALCSAARNAPEEAMVCSEALARIGSPSLPALQQMLEHAELRQRLWIYGTAGLIGDSAARQLLVSALTSEAELTNAIAAALADLGDPSVIPDLYSALQSCSPWQRIDIEAAITDLHNSKPPDRLASEDWRFRYRISPGIGMPPRWPLIYDDLYSSGDYQKRPIIEVRPLEEILADPPEQAMPERCECCNVETWQGTGVAVCPATALNIAMVQHRYLGESRHGHHRPDLFDLLDAVDVWLHQLEWAGEPRGKRARKKWEDQRARLFLQRCAARWAIEQGARDVGQARAVLLAEAMQLAHRYGDPEGYFTPTQAQRARSKTVRNDPCPCGSGRQLKKCCGRRESALSAFWDHGELEHSDYEDLNFSQAIYAVTNRAAVMTALESCHLLAYEGAHESYIWLEPIDAPIQSVVGVIRIGADWLVLESMSEARLDRLTTLVQTLAGDWTSLRGNIHDKPLRF